MTRFLIATTLCAGLAFVAPAAPAETSDTGSRIAIVSAYEPELAVLLDAVEDPDRQNINGVTFVTGRLEGQDVVLFLSGISMVNAAMTTQLALDQFEIEGIVFSGIAGGVDPALSIGDVVVAERWGQYIESVFARKTEAGYVLPPFLNSDFENYGMMHTIPVQVVRKGGTGVEERFWFPADAHFLEVARAAAATVTLDACQDGAACLEETPDISVGGNGVSGTAFIDNADFRAHVFKTFRARVLDMESAAVAHVAYANDLPFIAFRSLSDLAGGSDAENELDVFFGLAAGNSARVVRAFLAHLPEPGSSD
ncbi:MAG: 5'-methylthioadenosine/S-adenosylhomocysteine nucleosidase [Rhodobacteraceae bacterium]|nr:5'-methylthioadenosine/S-adenosylhomocysteine nucleosidase [Paracoccaceae bacterium]